MEPRSDDIDFPTCPVYRLKFEDRDLEAIDEWDVFYSWDRALTAFVNTVADPDPDFGSVYLTEDLGDDEVVVLGLYVNGVDPTS